MKLTNSNNYSESPFSRSTTFTTLLLPLFKWEKNLKQADHCQRRNTSYHTSSPPSHLPSSFPTICPSISVNSFAPPAYLFATLDYNLWKLLLIALQPLLSAVNYPRNCARPLHPPPLHFNQGSSSSSSSSSIGSCNSICCANSMQRRSPTILHFSPGYNATITVTPPPPQHMRLLIAPRIVVILRK